MKCGMEIVHLTGIYRNNTDINLYTKGVLGEVSPNKMHFLLNKMRILQRGISKKYTLWRALCYTYGMFLQ